MAIKKSKKSQEKSTIEVPAKFNPNVIEMQNMSDLLKEELPPLTWILDQVIPRGTTMLMGAPKTCKSFFAMQLAAAAMVGQPFCEGGPVAEKNLSAYFALDDPRTRLQDRFHQYSVYYDTLFSDMIFSMNWFPEEAEPLEGLKLLFEKYQNHNFYVMDIFTKVRLNGNDQRGGYKVDYDAVAPFKELFAEHNKSLLFTHHVNKPNYQKESDDWGDRLSGTNGIYAGIDTLMMLDKNQKTGITTLRVRSNDMEELAIELHFNKDKLLWEFPKLKEKQLDGKLRTYAQKLAKLQSFKAKDMSKTLGFKENYCRTILKRLREFNKLITDEANSSYSINPDNPYGITKSPIVSLHDPSVASIVNDIDLAHLDTIPEPKAKPKLNGCKFSSFARSNEKFLLKYTRTYDDNISISN